MPILCTIIIDFNQIFLTSIHTEENLRTWLSELLGYWMMSLFSDYSFLLTEKICDIDGDM